MVSKNPVKYSVDILLSLIHSPTCESAKKANKFCNDFNNSLLLDNISQLSTHCRNLIFTNTNNNNNNALGNEFFTLYKHIKLA